VHQAAEEIIKAVDSYQIDVTEHSLQQVRIILFDQSTLEIFRQALSHLQENQ
jgi:hypothetical protein